MLDQKTIDIYNSKADEYSRLVDFSPSGYLEDFINLFSKGSKILDLGCGTGVASEFMMKQGLVPDPVDGSEEMVKLSNQKPGLCARLCAFDELDLDVKYSGVYAHFSLLHLKKHAFLECLSVIKEMVLQDGTLVLGMKAGTGERRDSLGRFYAYYTEPELQSYFHSINFTVTNCYSGKSLGLSGDVEPWLVMFGRKL
ncbi:MAG: class I SAM-dependent methyltransferase [Proteobacteria bacterium]|jgi:SAM-dependent methyltransferase|nr:class I SAM-dependent methyltransferase [Pseudomonadota bacterium]